MRIKQYALFMLLFSTVGGCSNRGELPKRARLQQRTEFKITLSSGGGFTGMYSGYHLYASGLLEAWQKRAAGGDTLLWMQQVDPERIERIRAQLAASGALDKRYDGAGNMTVIVNYATADTVYRWSWDRGREEPTELAMWYQRTRRYCVENRP